MLVEMQTGQPLFPGTDDTDQLWLILKSCTDEQLATLEGSTVLQASRHTCLETAPLLLGDTHRFQQGRKHWRGALLSTLRMTSSQMYQQISVEI